MGDYTLSNPDPELTELELSRLDSEKELVLGLG